jgi:two-component sensor histidine kinase
MSTLLAVNSLTEAHDEIGGVIPVDLALDVANIGVWSWEPGTGAFTTNHRLRSLCGLTDLPDVLDTFLARIHADDRSRAASAMKQAASDGVPLKSEFRIASAGLQSERWVLMEGCRYLSDRAELRVAGTLRDVSKQKDAETEHEIVVQEMEHRIRNVFAVISAIVSLSERTVDTSGQLARALRRRIGALDRAYNSLSSAGGRACASLRQILETELAAFADLSVAKISGPPVLLHRERAIAMHLIAHELTTNALKYGALSRPGGRIEIRWEVDGSRLTLHWDESGTHGPKTPPRSGFGSRMMTLCARLNLGGDIICDYRPDGASITLLVPVARLWQS